MTDTTTTVTSDAKLCDCGAAFGVDDDKRFKTCASCRGATDDSGQPGVEPMQLPWEQEKVSEPPDQAYWFCGVTEDSPYHYFTLGGKQFQKYSGAVREDGEKQTFTDNTAPGNIHRLTQKDVDLVLEHVRGKVIRRWRKDETGKHLGEIRSKRGTSMAPYMAQEDDVPVGCFVWLIKVRHKSDRPTFADGPPTLVERPKGLAPKGD